MRHKLLSALCLIALLATLIPPPVNAAPFPGTTFIVNATYDAPDAYRGDGRCADARGLCTLRAAVEEANASPTTADTIALPAGTYLLTLPGRDEDQSATGDLDVRAPLTVYGAGEGRTVINGNALDRVWDISATTFTLNRVTVQNGDAATGGGGAVLIATSRATFTNVTLAHNAGGNGGGLFISNSTVSINHARIQHNRATAWAGGGLFTEQSTVTLTHAELTDNRADFQGPTGWPAGGGALLQPGSRVTFDAVLVARNHTAVNGGGIYNSGETLTIRNSAILSNTAGNAASAIINDNDASLSITNSTLAYNTSGEYGTLMQDAGGPVMLDSVTIVSNTARAGGGIFGWNSVSLRNSVLAYNVNLDGTPSDCAGPLDVSGYNLIRRTTNCTLLNPGPGLLTNRDPQLRPLAQHGTALPAFEPRPTSPLIDAADPVACPRTDQRGITRPVDGDGDGHARCDLGAIELYFPMPSSSAPSPSNARGGGSLVGGGDLLPLQLTQRYPTSARPFGAVAAYLTPSSTTSDDYRYFTGLDLYLILYATLAFQTITAFATANDERSDSTPSAPPGHKYRSAGLPAPSRTACSNPPVLCARGGGTITGSHPQPPTIPKGHRHRITLPLKHAALHSWL